MSDTSQNAPLLAYHQRTKHRFEAYAEGPGQLDWDAQPAPFRHFAGTETVWLPLAADAFERPFAALGEPPAAPVGATLDAVGALLELALGISAWKSWGPSRWALRCNPSSGNLHPVEGYVLTANVPGVPDGLHHYDPEAHQLETRAVVRSEGGAPWLVVGLSSAMWREAWKYGERAFRYCQLDVGHAVGALGYAAALLGWTVEALEAPSAAVARCLGLDRAEDFVGGRMGFTEAEEPEILLAVRGPGWAPPPDVETLVGSLKDAHWHGVASRIDPAPGYRWPVIDQAAAASRLSRSTPKNRPISADFPDYPPPLPGRTGAGTAQLIRQRRSGQRFDPKCTLDKAAFYRILDATLPRRQAPFDGQEAPPAIHLLLFVLRVDGLPSGLYLLPRTPAAAPQLQAALGAADGRFADACPVSTVDAECPAHLGLTLLAALGLQEMQRLARALSCHQDIAATGAFSLGMLADFSTLTDGYAYRACLREAGLVGQVLYLEAEAAGVRGTGIGCFFDDPVHQAFGLDDKRWQSVYHFTVGTPIVDTRIETAPPYPQRKQSAP